MLKGTYVILYLPGPGALDISLAHIESVEEALQVPPRDAGIDVAVRSHGPHLHPQLHGLRLQAPRPISISRRLSPQTHGRLQQ